MADPRPPDDQHPPAAAGPHLEAVRLGPRNRLRIALAVTLLAGVVGLAVVTRIGVLVDQDRQAALESGAPSSVDVAPSPTESAGPSTSAPPSASAPVALPIVPTAPTSPGLIAVVDDDGGLWTMDDGGGSRVRYPAPGVTFGFPAWSPDGRRVAAVGTSLDGVAIYVFDVPNAGATPTSGIPNLGQTDGPEPVVAYRSADIPPFYLFWTPDGHGIGFLASEAVGLSLRVAPADGSAPIDGSDPASVVRTGAPLYFDWLDPRRLLVHVGVGAAAFTGEVGLDGKPVGPALKGTGDFRSPGHSADGRYVAFVRSGANRSEQLVVVRRQGSASHQMAVVGPTAFEFDPAGDTLATIAADAALDPGQAFPVGPIRLIDPASGAVRTLLDRPAVAFFWSPDGRTIAAILPSRPGDDPATAGTGSGTVLAGAVVPGSSPSQPHQAPGVTARLAFVDVATGAIRSERVIALGDHFVNELLPYFDQYALSHRLWSPDSASILLPLVDPSGTTREAVVPADGSATRPVAYGPSGFWSP